MALHTLLPAPLNALVGREQELITLEALLARLDVRLLTVRLERSTVTCLRFQRPYSILSR